MSRSKQTFLIAIADLKQHLVDSYGEKDTPGLGSLTAVWEYATNLRRAKTQVTEELEDANKRVSAVTVRADSLRARVGELSEELSQLKNANQQLRSDIARLQRERAVLQAELEPSPLIEDEAMGSNTQAFCALAKDVRRRLRRPPRACGYARRQEVVVIELSDVVRGYGYRDDYQTLGMFTAMMALFGMPVAVVVPKELRIEPFTEKHLSRLMRWMTDWFRAKDDPAPLLDKQLVGRHYVAKTKTSDSSGVTPPLTKREKCRLDIFEYDGIPHADMDK